MNNKLAIEILKDMKDDIESTGNLTKDVEALDIAIKALEGTAPEVPVQEQSDEIADKVIEKMANALADALSN